MIKKRSNLCYTIGVSRKGVTSGGARLRGLTPGQHNSEETSQRLRAVGDTLSDLTGPGIEPQFFRVDIDVINNRTNPPNVMHALMLIQYLAGLY